MGEVKESKKTNKKDEKTNSKKLSLNKKTKKLKRGFTLVELLAAITILGILTTISIMGISGVIKRGQSQYYKTQEDNMVVAARNYAEKNPQYLPKVSGQTLKVSLNDLQNSKYIDKLVNYRKQSCDANDSYVQIFKYQDDFYYVPYLSCEPYYSDPLTSYSSFKNFDITYNTKLLNASASLKMQDDEYGIVSYNYVIYVDGKIVYKSEQFASFKTNSLIGRDVDLTSYVPAKIKITITAVNGQGVSNSYSKSYDYSSKTTTPSGEDNTSNYISCGSPIVNSSKTWTSADKIITVPCVSTDASLGCARDNFSKQYTTDLETDQIAIYDKNGNYKKCNVDVYIDKTAPTLTIKVYKLKSDGTKGDFVAEGVAKNGDTNKTILVNKNANNGWLNNANYPYGLFVEASYSDTSPIRNLTISQNNGGATSESDSNYNTIHENPSDPNKKSDSFSFTMTDDGYRLGKVAVTDSVGKTSSVTIKFQLDKTVPTCNISSQNSSWTKNDVNIAVGCSDTGTSGCTVESYSKSYKDENTVATDSLEISDNAGNKTTCSYNVYHDKQAPSCGNNSGSTSWTNQNRTVSVDCSETFGSGCTKNSFSNEFKSTKTSDNITISDSAGNSRNCPVNVYVDKTAPVYDGCDNTGMSGKAYMNTYWHDDHSGISSWNSLMEYCYHAQCSGGTNACTNLVNSYGRRSTLGGNGNYWFSYTSGYIEGNKFYAPLNNSCARKSGQYLTVHWRLCDNAGNCGLSGERTFNFHDGSC